MKPQYQTKFSAGLDLRTPYMFFMGPQERQIIDTGVYLKDVLPDDMLLKPKMYNPLEVVPFAMVCSRSGLAANDGIIVLNAPGIIDADYEETIKVILYNTNPTSSIRIPTGARIAQLVFSFAYRKTELVKDEGRQGGLGSTGE